MFEEKGGVSEFTGGNRTCVLKITIYFMLVRNKCKTYTTDSTHTRD